MYQLASPAALHEPDNGDVLHEGLLWLINSWPRTAAIVHNRYIDVLAANRLARAISPNFRSGVNGLSTLLFDPRERALHHDWEGLVARWVALLRTMSGTRLDDPRLGALVAELTARSELFRELWKRNDVTLAGRGIDVLIHPLVGELVVHYARLPLAGTGGQTLLLYFAEPGSATFDAFDDLTRSEW